MAKDLGLSVQTIYFDESSVNSSVVANSMSFMGPIDTGNHSEWPGTSSCNHSVLMLKVVAGANCQDTYQRVWPEGFHEVDAALLHP